MIKRYLVVCVFFLLVVSSIGALSMGNDITIPDNKIFVKNHEILNLIIPNSKLPEYKYHYLQRSLLKYNIQTENNIDNLELITNEDDIGFQELNFQDNIRGSETAGNHDPISIIGNENFTAENGVTGGSGITEDPYIIEGWVIAGNGSTKAGIYICNTSAAFVIRNCSISNFYYEFFKGIRFDNVTAGKIEDVEVFKNYYGIDIWQSSFIIVENCVCYNNYGVYATGIYVFRSHHIIISDCECYRISCSLSQMAADGIKLWGSSYCQIRNSTCYSNRQHGIDLFLFEKEFPLQYNVIENCTVYKNGCGGIFVFEPWEDFGDIRHGYNRISDCVVYDNGHLNVPGIRSALPGIWLYELDDSIVENCVLYGNGVGVEIANSCNNLIRNCTMYGHWQPPTCFGCGVFICDSGRLFGRLMYNNTIEHCDIFDQDVGIFSYSAIQTIIRSNNIYNHTYFGIYVDKTFTPAMGVIHGNNIYNNAEGNRFDRLTFFDARDNWWGSFLGPSRWPGHFRGDVIWTRLVCMCLRFPWATKSFADAGVMNQG